MKGFERCDECRRSGVELNFAGAQLLCEPCASGNGSLRSHVLADHTIKNESKTTPIERHREAERGLESPSLPSTKQLSVGIDPMTARIRALGITADLNEPFSCILPGHDGHQAHVHPDGQHWRYSCDVGGRSGMLGEVYGRIAYGDADRYISAIEGARWGERLDHDAGLLDAGEPWLVPADASDGVRRVIGGLWLFLALRDAAGKFPDAEFTFARGRDGKPGFGVAYCGVTDDQFRQAMYQLERRYRLIERAGMSGGAIVWRRAAAASVVDLSDRRAA